MKNIIIITIFAILAYFASMFLLELRTDKAFEEVCKENNGSYDPATNVCDLGTEVIDLPEESEIPQDPNTSAKQIIESKKNLIVVDSLEVGQEIASPLKITGKARGYWYFEASFPVYVKDANGNTIGTGIGTAKTDWMTEDFVDFEANISFTAQPAGSVGTVVLAKDNPSGLPENDDSLVYPVQF